VNLVENFNSNYWCHKGFGHIWFDPGRGTKHFDPNWALLLTDRGIIEFYAWLAGTRGIKINTRGLWGPHISFIKGEEPTRNRTIWGMAYPRPVEFFYSNIVRMDNKKHAWLDVWSNDLRHIRSVFGLRDKNTFHLTIGLLK
jgi:hypothetical protein